ncbi:MAG: ParA family protein, partial [Actinomycetia bacterium]|nr:ParA family protein [Actinomycetes bacterium]
MIVAVASRKASPGVTTLTTLLAAYWHEPGASRLVVEADPSGGTLAARLSTAHPFRWAPDFLSLATTRGRL